MNSKVDLITNIIEIQNIFLGLCIESNNFSFDVRIMQSLELSNLTLYRVVEWLGGWLDQTDNIAISVFS